ncbi:hypothetical protein ANO11243_076710 [Dothideomycetidae sp. 11243]|nr:hypothetical protein ANO11243_076710 [fungal sp. No.11243]
MSSSTKSFNPDRDIPDLSGKVILVTGGNAGLGKETVRHLVKHNPKAVFLAARTRSKAEAAIEEIKRESPNATIQFIELDVSSFESINAAVKTFHSRSDRLDVLINNAGIMNQPYSLTKDGLEIQMGTNHVGPALLTKLLMPTLLRTAESSDVRVVNLSSSAFQFTYFAGGPVLDTKSSKYWPTFVRYGSTKLANMLHARGLAERYPQITAASVHPGVIDTGLFDASRALFSKIPLIGGLLIKMVNSTLHPVDEGALNTLWAATAPKQEVRKGYYFVPVGSRHGGGFFSGKGQADKLWSWTERELKKRGY